MPTRYIKTEKNIRGMEIEDSILTATEPEKAKIEIPLDKKWLKFFWWLVLASIVVLGGRIFYLNIVRGSYYQEIAKNNRIRSLYIQAPRGKIYDRAGKVLVNNVPSLDAIAIPADLPQDSGSRREISENISQILGINAADAWRMIENVNPQSLEPILLKSNISQKESLIILEKNQELPGIRIEKTAVRDYVDSVIFSHILGYEGKIRKEELEENKGYFLIDYIGKQGLEKSYEKYLRGTAGAYQIEVDSLGNVKRELGIINPRPGEDLILNIDADLQKKVFDSLNSLLEKTETKTAAAVAINPQNGEVLALVSLPSYDNNMFTQNLSAEDYSKLANDPDKPFFNRAISGEYPPGSTIKPLIASAALSEKTINENTTVNCPGAINVGTYRFGDWKTHGTMNVRSAIAESCDVFFYSLGGGYGNIEGLGMDRMKKYEQLFGWGEKSGIDIPGESVGLVPDGNWKLEKFGEKWYVGDSYHAAIGQGFVSATPLQLVDYIATIANGGTLYQPHIVSQIKEISGKTLPDSAKIIRDNIIPESVLSIVREGMRQAITSGTARSLSDLPVAVAGKTGTAQFGKDNKTHGWFVSFAPYENPTIAMVVLVEGGGEGSSSAVPVTKEVYDWYFSRK